jgi:hypothetical protein
MVYGLLGCFVEENYRHNIRRTLNNFKLNVEDIKPKIINNIRYLLTYNRTKLINKIFEDIKINLNKVKVNPLPKNCGMYYYKLDFDTEYYLYEELGEDDKYEKCYNITKTKKIWLDEIKTKLTYKITDERYITLFEEGLNKYGKMKFNNNPCSIEVEMYCCNSNYYNNDNNKLLDFISK